MVSFDLVNMFTSIPVDEAIDRIRTYLLNDPTLKDRTNMPVDVIVKLLQMSTSMAYFVWKGTHYRQTKGAAMGSSTSSPISNAYMEGFEQKATTQYDTGDHNTTPEDILQLWLCIADDTLTFIDEDHIKPFHDWLNSIHPDLQWTYKVEKEGRINFLDVTIIHAQDGSLSFEVYRKPTKDAYDQHCQIPHQEGYRHPHHTSS